MAEKKEQHFTPLPPQFTPLPPQFTPLPPGEWSTSPVRYCLYRKYIVTLVFFLHPHPPHISVRFFSPKGIYIYLLLSFQDEDHAYGRKRGPKKPTI